MFNLVCPYASAYPPKTPCPMSVNWIRFSADALRITITITSISAIALALQCSRTRYPGTRVLQIRSYPTFEFGSHPLLLLLLPGYYQEFLVAGAHRTWHHVPFNLRRNRQRPSTECSFLAFDKFEPLSLRNTNSNTNTSNSNSLHMGFPPAVSL
eukprot:3168048-Rhodomonas_salina.2